MPDTTQGPRWRRVLPARNARHTCAPPVLPPPLHVPFARPAARPWDAKIDETEEDVSEGVPSERGLPTRVAAAVDSDADGADSDREGLEAVLRQGWAGGLGSMAR
jgi:hypothetical protein